MTSNVVGIDVNKYNGDVNFQTAWDAGARFVIIKAGGGYSNIDSCYTDIQFIRNIEEAPKIFQVLGVYFYLIIKNDIVKQANFFADTILPYLDIINLPIWCDFEQNFDLSQFSCSERLLLFMNTLEGRISRDVGIYTRIEFWNRSVERRSVWQYVPLWAARYKEGLTSPWSDGYYEPLDWPLDSYDNLNGNSPFWQFSADGNNLGTTYGAPPPPAADRDMDLDYYHGSYEHLLGYVGVSVMPTIIRIKNLNGVVIRSCANGRFIGCVPVDTKFVVDEELVDSNNVKWYRSGSSYIPAPATEIVSSL